MLTSATASLIVWMPGQAGSIPLDAGFGSTGLVKV
jgi:hypothetical protein